MNTVRIVNERYASAIDPKINNIKAIKRKVS